MKTVGVNRAPVRIRNSGWFGDSGRDTFENNNNNNNKKVNKRIKRASRKGVLLLAYLVE